MKSIRLTKEKGTVLFRPHQDCLGFVELEKGSIRVSLTGETGREVVLYRVTPGDICLQTFSCLIENRHYSAEGIAECDIEGRLIPAGHFKRLMADDADFRERIFAAIAHRFADYQQLVEEIALTGFDARLARALLRLQDTEAIIRATHDQLAAETASGRAVVSRRLSELAKKGVVALSRGQVTILDKEQLKKLSGASV